MKIAFPVTDMNLYKCQLASGLNVNGFLCIYDTFNHKAKWIKTLDLAPNMGELLPALERENVHTIITRKIQPMALKVLVNKGFQVYQSVTNYMEENIALLKNKELKLHTIDSAMEFAKVCGGECDECSTTCDTSKIHDINITPNH
jgi:predicted Fe-Mo cluster-binding NifX family protein